MTDMMIEGVTTTRAPDNANPIAVSRIVEPYQSGLTQRWERRLTDLVNLDLRDEEIAIDPELTGRCRMLLTALDDIGFDTSPLRLFITSDGSYEILHRQREGVTRTLEIASTGLEVHDIDTQLGTARSYGVANWRAALSAISFE